MGLPAAKYGDQVTGMDTHLVLITTAHGTVPTPLPHPFNGKILQECSATVRIMGQPAATVGSKAINTPPHVPQGGPFATGPTNEGVITTGSATVKIEGKPAARNGDTALTCNDPAPAPNGKVVVTGATVMIG